MARVGSSVERADGLVEANVSGANVKPRSGGRSHEPLALYLGLTR
ncbi:MAG TPA: hypothetical protein VF104_03405 [Burkholderiales bacterium]